MPVIEVACAIEFSDKAPIRMDGFLDCFHRILCDGRQIRASPSYEKRGRNVPAQMHGDNEYFHCRKKRDIDGGEKNEGDKNGVPVHDFVNDSREGVFHLSNLQS